MSLFTLPVVLDLVAKATVILAVTGLAAALLRRASASTRHFVWTLGIVSALVAPALTVSLPRWELPIVRIQSAAPVSAVSTPAASLQQRQAPALGRTQTNTPAAAARPSASVTTSWTMPSWPVLALMVWALGAAAIIARLLIGLVAVQWMSRRSVEVTDAEWLEDAHALAANLGLRNVRFLHGAAGTMPMAWGVFRSSVLVPADADAWPSHRIRVVLLHELAHVKRRDCLTHLVAQIACAVYWFNPLVWMATRRLRSERERACDDLVLAAGTRGSDYADELLDIARVMTAGRFPAVLAGASLAMARRSQLEGRLIAILDPSVARRGLTRARAVAACSVFAIILMAVASVQPWAEERALTKDDQQAQQPIESYPGQAAADNRANAASQDAIQGAVQGAVQGRVQAQVQGRTQAEIQSHVQSQIQAGIQGGIQGGVHGGVPGGVVGGVVSSVATAIANVVADGAVQVSQEVARELERERDRGNEQEKDAKSQGKVRDPRAVNALMEALKDTDKDVRETAMAALVQMRDPRMFDPLVQALKDSNADVREHAAFGLGQLRDNRAIEPLTAAIKDQNASVREQVVFALGQLRAVGAIDALTVALKDSADDVREQAAFALSQIRDKRAVDPLISALKDAKPDVREQAAFALGQLRDPKAVDALVIALKDADADVREQAAFALGQIGDARAIDGLTAALKDANSQVRQQAAFALGQIR